MVLPEIVAVRTDAGMLSLWASPAFTSVTDYDSWETHVTDRLDEAIRAGELVPINIGSDGAWGVRLGSAAEGLSERERSYALATSEPYKLIVEGGAVCLSGIEGVGLFDHAAARIELADGTYSVQTTLVAWADEPGARGSDGLPVQTALADFVVLIGPSTGSEHFRTREMTFDLPE